MLQARRRPSPFQITLILGALTTISPFSIDMYLPAFNQVAAQFHTSAQVVSLSLSSYFVGLALGQVFYGPLLDRFGRKPPLYFGLILYVLASVACIFAPGIHALIALRFLQAVGGCSAGVGATSMVADFFETKERANVFSRLMLVLSVSPLFAPTIGGFIGAAWGWKSIFVILAGITSAILLVVFFFLPEGHEPDPGISLHPGEIARGFSTILRNRQFQAYAVAGAFSFAGLFAYVAASPAVFMDTFRFTQKEFSLVFALLSIGVVGGGQLNIFLGRWFTTEEIFSHAMRVQFGVAALLFTSARLHWFGAAFSIALFAIYLACVGLTLPNSTALGLAPFDKTAGSAAALIGFLQTALGAIAAFIFGVLHMAPTLSLGILFLASSLAAQVTYLAARARPQATAA